MYRIRERFFDVGDDVDILDNDGNAFYRVDGKVLTLRSKLVIEDTAGNEVASVHRHLVALRPTYEVRIGDEKVAEVKKNRFTPFREKFTIDVEGSDDLEMRGNLLDHEFTVEQGGREVAAVSKRWFTVRDTYGVDIADGVNHLLILCSVLALDLALARAEEKEQDE